QCCRYAAPPADACACVKLGGFWIGVCPTLAGCHADSATTQPPQIAARFIVLMIAIRCEWITAHWDQIATPWRAFRLLPPAFHALHHCEERASVLFSSDTFSASDARPSELIRDAK